MNMCCDDTNEIFTGKTKKGLVRIGIQNFNSACSKKVLVSFHRLRYVDILMKQIFWFWANHFFSIIRNIRTE
jgi:hypothetical protein